MSKQQLPNFITETPEGFQIELAKAMSFDGENVTYLNMREPTVHDLLTAEMQTKGQSDSAQEIAMFANLCAVSPENIKSLVLRNYKRVQEAFKLFTV